MKKLYYTSPEVNVLVIRFEGRVLLGSGNDANRNYVDEEDLGEI